MAEVEASTEEKDLESMTEKELTKLSAELEKKMHKYAVELEFEKAAELRDRLVEIRKQLQEIAH